MSETVLIVDDEEGVRRTFQEWLSAAEPDLKLLVAADAEAALLAANSESIDLAVLDWNLGSGSDGLRLLEDLVDFHPDIVAILITGFAGQATPLEALRMGVRDYLDKNQDLTRETFLASVRKQLERIRPAKERRAFSAGLAAFREAVEKTLPLVRAAAMLNDPVPLPQAIHALLRFLLRATGARDGALVLHPAQAEFPIAYAADGSRHGDLTIPFEKTLAAGVVSMGEPCVVTLTEEMVSLELLEFEKGRRNVLAVPLSVGSGVGAVLELFDKEAFTDADRQIASAAAEIGSDLLRHAIADRHSHRMLVDAVEAALRAGENVTRSSGETPTSAALASLKETLSREPEPFIDSETGLRLMEALRALAERHGPEAIAHCLKVVESLRTLLDATNG